MITIQKCCKKRILAVFLATYAAFLTFVPYVNPGISHWKAVLFSLFVALAAALAQALFPGKADDSR